MKLLITLVLASMLVLKTAEGVDVAGVDTTCASGDTCTADHATCKDKSDGNGFKCYCDDNYEKSGDACKLSNGQTCTGDDGCASGFCKGDTGKTCAATKDLDATCTDADRCTDDNAECKDDGSTDKCLCKTNYENKEGACKLSNGQGCDADDKCASGFCNNDDTRKCGSQVALDGECADEDKCTDDNAECKDDSDTKKCLCKDNYEKADDTCKLSNGQTCSADGDCAKGTCPTAIKKCGKANDETCTDHVECASGNCKTLETDSGTEKKCADGASAIVASVLLMVSALLTARFL